MTRCIPNPVLLLLLLVGVDAGAEDMMTPWQPVPLQQHSDSCGASAAARWLALSHDIHLDEADVSNLMAWDPRHHGSGASLAQLARGLELLGFESDVGRLDASTLRERAFPVLLRLLKPTQHYVLVQHLGAKWSQIFDPARGFLWIDTQVLLARWQDRAGFGVILELVNP